LVSYPTVSRWFGRIGPDGRRGLCGSRRRRFVWGPNCAPFSGWESVLAMETATLPLFTERGSLWQPTKPRNAHIRFVRVRSLQRSIAARSARRWKKFRTWIANARIRSARVEQNTPRTHSCRARIVNVRFPDSPETCEQCSMHSLLLLGTLGLLATGLVKRAFLSTKSLIRGRERCKGTVDRGGNHQQRGLSRSLTPAA
jgi:hypothetical protein